jgi:general secretion pathway protein K
MRFKAASILVLTLWVLSFLSVFAVGLTRNLSSQLRFASHFKDRLRLNCLAYAGIERAIIELQADDEPAYDSFTEKWASRGEFKEITLGEGKVSFYIEDEAGRININKAPLPVLKAMLENAGEVESDTAGGIANAIIDWRDTDIIVSPGGAENDYYQRLKVPYPCKNAEFQAPEELLLVKGMSLTIFSKLAGVITVYGEGKVNVNTADEDVLHALGLSKELARQIVEFRRGSDGLEGTEDDSLFKTPAEIRNIGPLFTQEAEEINRLTSSNILDVKSDVFRIVSSGVIQKASRDLQNRVTCVVQRSGEKSPLMLYWYEG